MKTVLICFELKVKASDKLKDLNRRSCPDSISVSSRYLNSAVGVML